MEREKESKSPRPLRSPLQLALDGNGRRC